MKTVYYVIPCYNEQEALPDTVRQLLEKLHGQIEAGLAAPTSRLLFVDDGSKDGTWALIREICLAEPLCCGLKLTRNRGHQNALLAGLMLASYAIMFVVLRLESMALLLGTFVLVGVLAFLMALTAKINR